MTWRRLAVNEFNTNIFDLWDNTWFLLTAGSFADKKFNSMTISWGSLGVMWDKPFAQVVVRPTRYTHGFMEKYDSFTLCAFGSAHRKALQIMGSKSGRAGDKIAASGLTPTAARIVAAPVYAEAELILECRKMYWQDIDPTHFLDETIQKNYPKQDYHRIYFGEILAILRRD